MFPTIRLGHGRVLDWSRPYIVGVLNVTPDSFSDGGAYASLDAAVARAFDMVARGADIVDIGGESTRPGAQPVATVTEMERVIPVIRALCERGLQAPLSIDTTKAQVAAAALDAGAEIVNDISGGRFDPRMIEVVSARGAVYVCGHVRGADIAAVHASESAPPTAEDVAFELAERVTRLPAALRHRTIVDPCLGFGKGLEQNLELIRWSGQIARAVGCPVMIGPSRKRFVRRLLATPERLSQGADQIADTTGRDARAVASPGAGAGVDVDAGTVGACLAAVAAGAHLLRVHDVALLRPALDVYRCITLQPG